MRPLHPRNLESDITFMQNGGGHTMDTMREHVERRLACSAKVLALLSSDSDAPDARLPDPLVFMTGERSLPTSVFLPHALEGSADNISAADLCAWARVCSAWAGWVRRLLADPSSLRWLWARLVESHIQEAGISCLRHPELSTRSTLRVLLSEQRERDEGTTAAMDALAGEDVEMADPSKVWPSEVAGGVADLFAFFANFFDAPDIEYEERARPHGMLSDLAFRPYLSAQGEYAAPEAAWEMRDMVVGLCDIVREYSEWVRESEDVSQNLILSTILLPQLRSIVCSLMTFLEIDDTSQQDGHPRSLTVRASSLHSTCTAARAYAVCPLHPLLAIAGRGASPRSCHRRQGGEARRRAARLCLLLPVARRRGAHGPRPSDPRRTLRGGARVGPGGGLPLPRAGAGLLLVVDGSRCAVEPATHCIRQGRGRGGGWRTHARSQSVSQSE